MLVIPWKLPQGWGTPEIKPCTSHAWMLVTLAIDNEASPFSSSANKMARYRLTLARLCFIMPSASLKGLKHIGTRMGRLPSFVLI